MKGYGIHMRLLIAAFLLICTATFVLAVVGVHITRQFMLTRFQDRISFLARYLASNAEVGVLMGDNQGLKSLALNLLGEEDVARVVVFDNNDGELVNISKPVPGPLSTVEAPVHFKRYHDENIVFDSRSTPFGPIRTPGDLVIGKVNIAFSTSGINSLIANITRRFIWVSFALAMTAGLVFYVISRSIVLDVTRLADAVRKVGRGDLGLRTEPGNLPETRELAMAFNTMLDSLAGHREALVKANQEMARHQALAELGKFSLMIAHEVKNPLGIIKISFDFLKRDLEIPQDNAMVEYIEDEIVRLNGLIEEFLLFARPAKPTFRPVDLNGMAKEMIDRVALQNTESDVKLETDLPQSSCEILADPDLLTRALGNIVKNAYEANDGKGVVSISARLEKREWVLEVSDDGPGIPQENLEQVFEPFFTTKSKGTGLGLAFSKQILIAHRGTITARNRERGGATFEARIPIERGG